MTSAGRGPVRYTPQFEASDDHDVPAVRSSPAQYTNNVPLSLINRQERATGLVAIAVRSHLNNFLSE